jgi:hypothetical protein
MLVVPSNVLGHLLSYLILPSFLHEYDLSKSHIPDILSNLPTYSLLYGPESLVLRASSLALPVAIIVNVLFFFQFRFPSSLIMFQTEFCIQGIHETQTSDSHPYVTELPRIPKRHEPLRLRSLLPLPRPRPSTLGYYPIIHPITPCMSPSSIFSLRSYSSETFCG